MADRGRRRGGGGRGRGDFTGRGRGGDRGDRGGRRDRSRGGGGSGRGGCGGFEAVKFWGDEIFPAPDAETTKLEDASVKDYSTILARTSLVDQFPRRPGYGTAGRSIVLWTNYFDLKGVSKDNCFYLYSVAFQPDNQLSKPKKKRLIQILLERAPFASISVASDGAQVLVASKEIDLGGSRQTYDIEWYPTDGKSLPATTSDYFGRRSAARKRNTVKLLVEEIGTASLSELMKDLSAARTTYPLKLEIIQALNIILSYGSSTGSNIATAPQNKFYPLGKHPNFENTDLGGGLEALRGYFPSVRTSINRILVNVNVATGAFYKSGPLLDLLKEVNYGRAPNGPEEHPRMAAFGRKLRIETNYIPETDRSGKLRKAGDKPVTKRKVHVIGDLSPYKKDSINATFAWTDPNGQTKTISVQQYFQQMYSMTLALPNAPLVNYGTRGNPKWIPGELCSVAPGQLARRILQGDQTRGMIRFAARQPYQNAKSICHDGLNVIKINPVAGELNTNLTKFGIEVNPTMLTVHGRVLNAPELAYKSRKLITSDGAWNLDTEIIGTKPFSLPKALPLWNCLVIKEGNRETVVGGEPRVKDLLGLFTQFLKTCGMAAGPVEELKFTSINFFDLQNRNVDKVRQQLAQAIQDFRASPKFLFVLLPSEMALLYDCVKYVCDIKFGIPCVCNIGKKWSRVQRQAQYFANVALKFNQKCGGINHFIDIGQLEPLDARTIIFGIDVSHPSPGSAETSPSIAGVVASVDTQFSQYPASIRTQQGRKEMVTELEEMILERLHLWKKCNKGLPSKVIVYRDGVSEGQYKDVMEKEYPAFEEAFKKLYGAAVNHPKISIIIVGKRHHTRFYPTKKQDADPHTSNPLPGTVVGRGVTGEKLFDFFLLAHKVLQGTSKPAHYVVLKDENRFGADQLQILTHNLCYTFARATRVVSICPPAYYADLLCKRGRAYLHGVLKGDGSVAFTSAEWQRDVHPALPETMFYL
ncbi:Piwi-domain-containing protein [Lindgomyces ingoldianus]|uniref:Piwi-domain-containing protein n=1 Tax=Lindgomyces ingoldianus TaxID=673940 RepID=A0ACB6QR24_9PLEO|nr:Piwi-domain-containing protein [Lindgomyces ingoldianus]KAF2468621.1 Piwi-domain-containing protein [Lindgomyces ingoldianus]